MLKILKVPHNLIHGKGHLMINWEISILFVYSEVLSDQLIYTKNRQAMFNFSIQNQRWFAQVLVTSVKLLSKVSYFNKNYCLWSCIVNSMHC